MLKKVIEVIERQQKGKESTAVFMVGEQLKDICKNNTAAAELVYQDLRNKAMSLEECEKKIKEYADKQKRKGNCVCVPPNVAEDIIRKFYGIDSESFKAQTTTVQESKATSLFDLI